RSGARVRASTQGCRRARDARVEVELRSARHAQARLHGQLGLAPARLLGPQPLLLGTTPRTTRSRPQQPHLARQTAPLPLPRRPRHARAQRPTTHTATHCRLPVPEPVPRRARTPPTTPTHDHLTPP